MPKTHIGTPLLPSTTYMSLCPFVGHHISLCDAMCHWPGVSLGPLLCVVCLCITVSSRCLIDQVIRESYTKTG